MSDALNNDLATRLFPLFTSHPQSPYELIIDSFLNEISSVKENLHIVLDDYHYIEHPIIHEMMIRFIDYLPNNTRVYILSRTNLPQFLHFLSKKKLPWITITKGNYTVI